MIPFEFPPGSGRVADYDVEESEMMRRLVRRREQGDRAALNEIRVLHELKVVFGVNIVRDETGD